MDSNVVDWIADTPGARELMAAALQREAFSLIDMHIIRAQLAAAPDPARRTLLLETYDSLPKQPVASHGFVMGTSALGRATLGDGKESGVSIDEVKPGGRGAVQDALIATLHPVRRTCWSRPTRAFRKRCGGRGLSASCGPPTTSTLTC
jgi:hypothetical protein